MRTIVLFIAALFLLFWKEEIGLNEGMFWFVFGFVILVIIRDVYLIYWKE